MWRRSSLFFFALAFSQLHAEEIKGIYNRQTGRTDFITALSTNSIKAGAGVTVTTTAAGVTIGAVGGGGGSGYIDIQEEGVDTTKSSTMNFVGSGVTAAYNAGTGVTDITITASAPSLPLLPGDTNYIQNRNTLQTGATFYVSSGTVLSWLGVGSNNIRPLSGGLVLQDPDGGYIFIGDDGANPAVGINTAAPDATLMVVGNSQFLTHFSAAVTTNEQVWGTSDGDIIGQVVNSDDLGVTPEYWIETSPLGGHQKLIKVSGNSSIGTSLSIYSAAGANFVALKASDTIGTDWKLVLPSTWSSTGKLLSITNIDQSVSPPLIYTDWATDQTGAGGGTSFSLAVTTSTSGAFTDLPVSSSSIRTNLIFDSTAFTLTLTGGTTIFVAAPNFITNSSVAATYLYAAHIYVASNTAGTSMLITGTNNAANAAPIFNVNPASVTTSGQIAMYVASNTVNGSLTQTGTVGVLGGAPRLGVDPSSVTTSGQIPILLASATAGASMKVTGTNNVLNAAPIFNVDCASVTCQGVVVSSMVGTGVVPNTYTLATIAVDAQGRVTSASNGTGGAGDVVLKATQTFSGANTFQSSTTFSGSVSTVTFAGSTVTFAAPIVMQAGTTIYAKTIIWSDGTVQVSSPPAGGSSLATLTIASYTVQGTSLYTVPTSATSLDIWACGGGGGGGAGNGQNAGTARGGGSGGGGGACTMITVSTTFAGSSFYVVVGTGGPGGVGAADNNGGNGTGGGRTSLFTAGGSTFCAVYGGGAGRGSQNNAGAGGSGGGTLGAGTLGGTGALAGGLPTTATNAAGSGGGGGGTNVGVVGKQSEWGGAGGGAGVIISTGFAGGTSLHGGGGGGGGGGCSVGNTCYEPEEGGRAGNVVVSSGTGGARGVSGSAATAGGKGSDGSFGQAGSGGGAGGGDTDSFSPAGGDGGYCGGGGGASSGGTDTGGIGGRGGPGCVFICPRL